MSIRSKVSNFRWRWSVTNQMPRLEGDLNDGGRIAIADVLKVRHVHTESVDYYFSGLVPGVPATVGPFETLEQAMAAWGLIP